MNRAGIELVAWFVAGLTAVSTGYWLLRPADVPLASQPNVGLPGEEPRVHPDDSAFSRGNAAPDSADHIHMQESSERLLATALAVIRTADPQERAARWSLVLGQLVERGPAGLDAIAAFLATGEDLPLGLRLELPGIKLTGPRTLRMAALSQLPYFKSPAAQALHIRETLRSLSMAPSPEDSAQLIQYLEYVQPGKHRAAITEAARRAAEGDDPDAMRVLSQVVTRFGATELVSAAEARALKDPEKDMPEFLGMLWSVPPKVREEATGRILAAESPAAWLEKSIPKLDYQSPAAREATIAWFSGQASTTAKIQALENLASTEKWGAHFGFSSGAATVGNPGTAAQAEARLKVLDEIARWCTTPALAESWEAARVRLERQRGGPR
jgi:hypothetical protein